MHGIMQERLAAETLALERRAKQRGAPTRLQGGGAPAAAQADAHALQAVERELAEARVRLSSFGVCCVLSASARTACMAESFR